MEDIKPKFETIMNNIDTELSNKELTRNQYGALLCRQLKSQGFIAKDDSMNDAQTVGYFMALFERQLSIKRKTGLINEYYMLNTTLISDITKEDIDKYGKISSEAKQYLNKKIGKDKINRSDFRNLISEFVNLNTVIKDIEEYRKTELTGALIGTYERKFDVKPDETLIAGYDERTIEKALKELN